jgi:hypothetical protein
MAAGLGFKTFTTGEVLTAADTNGYLMQGINVFASTAARDAAITSPQEGQFAYTKDTNSLWYYTGSAWAASGATGDIEGVTAGVGITGGGTSGTVTITNDMATTITASGDIVVGTGSGTYDNLPIGTTNQVLTADTTVSPYKVKWATPAGGSTLNYTSLSSATPSGTTYTVTVASYNYYIIFIDGVTASSGLPLYLLRLNGDATSKYGQSGFRGQYASTVDRYNVNFNAGTSFQFLEGGNASGNDNYAVIKIEGGNSAGLKLLQANSAPQGSQGDIYSQSGTYSGTSAITSISLIEQNGFTWTGGTVRIYGSN